MSKIKTVWVVVGSDHDYDAGSQWVVGVYLSEESANKAAKADRAKYKGWIKPSGVDYEVSKMPVSE